MTRTPQGWEEEARAFYAILGKLDLDDLKQLTDIFECRPSYVGEVTKSWCIEFLWDKLRVWRLGNDRAIAMSEALRVLIPR